RISKIAVGGDMVYYLKYGQMSRVSGANYYGEYGNGLMVGLDSGSTAVNVSGLVRVFAAALTGYGIVESGKLYGWGNNFAGLIDTTLSDRIAVPVGMLPEIRFREGCVTYGYENSGSVRFASDSGDVYVWGSNKHGQLGLSDAYIKAPTKINLPMPCIALAGGTMHTIALLRDGTVWSWGDNTYGQLGNPFLGVPYATSTITPVKAIGLNDVVEIAAAGTSSYAITRDGTLYGWGDNTYRQLNRDDAPRQYTPVPLPLPCALVSDVKESRSQNSIVVSPNPARDLLTIATPAEEMSMPLVVSVYSVHGEHLLTRHFEVMDKLHVDVSGLTAGTYHAVVSNGNVQLHSTFVKLP
ncbi:MAG: T9SS type A sorting domain-containing protein, partial [Candidatus Kapabacteria bacterium]|nr:T9SS type A sorting domain-containing protein [Candidatus Kapabacteria bacterium]